MLILTKKPDISDLNRASPLINRCLFAAMPGYQRGFNPSGSEVWIDNISRVRAAINGSTSGTTSFDYPGWSADAGNSIDLQEITDILTVWDFSTDPMSFAVLCRIIDDPNTAAVFCKRTGLGAANTGWSINALAGPNNWQFEVSDGVSQENFTFGSFTLGLAWQLLVVTVDHLGNARGYVDGVLGGTASLTNLGTSVNNNESIKLFGDDTGPNDQIDAQVSMAAFWDRELNPQEVQELARDPFTMWRHRDEFFEGQEITTAAGTYFLVF